jgi:hypothetical protein
VSNEVESGTLRFGGEQFGVPPPSPGRHESGVIGVSTVTDRDDFHHNLSVTDVIDDPRVSSPSRIVRLKGSMKRLA